jgi:hypothetical protein
LEVSKILSNWNSVALFFNLVDSQRPVGYVNTTVQDALNWLDEGVNPCNPTISEFMTNYWSSLSLGKLAFGINTPRQSSALTMPIIKTLSSQADDWPSLINEYLDLEAESIWKAAGKLMRGNKRWIPSLVLVENYPSNASAFFGGYDRNVGGIVYEIGDTTHIQYDLRKIVDTVPVIIPNSGRWFWGTLCHEHSHNFLEFGDLYGPQGCTGYWDLLGDNSFPSVMSEVCSHLKERVGWITFKHTIRGPLFTETDFSLAPYSTSGDAIKIIPDPNHNPYEFFLLEYRKSTGKEVWRPDGALSEEGGLLIIHMNERLGVASTWLLRDAPYFDPEFADFSDNGGTWWTSYWRLNGVLYPYSGNDSFYRTSKPNSNFYGGRPSGLEITHIRIESGKVHFRIRIQESEARVGWTVSPADRCIQGKFTPESRKEGQEIFCRNDDSAALLIMRQAQWLVLSKQDDWIDGWNLGFHDRELAADMDGDGFDEIYIQSPDWAGVLKWQGDRFHLMWIKQSNIEHINGNSQERIDLTTKDQSYVGKFLPDRECILHRNETTVAILSWQESINQMRIRQYMRSWLDNRWNLGTNDKFVLGDFHRLGPDIGEPSRDFIFDNLTDVFIHNAWGTGMFSVNVGNFNSTGPYDVDQIGLSWINASEIPAL